MSKQEEMKVLLDQLYAYYDNYENPLPPFDGDMLSTTPETREEYNKKFQAERDKYESLCNEKIEEIRTLVRRSGTGE